MSGRSVRAKENIDLLVATALTEEAQVVSAVMSRVAKERSKRDHVTVYDYPLGDGTTARVATASAHQMGAVNMGMFIAPPAERLAPPLDGARRDRGRHRHG